MASSSSTAAAAFTRLLPAAPASRLPRVAAAAFVRLPSARYSTAWGGAAAPRPRRWAPGVAYATAATEKSIYDFTVKVKPLLSVSAPPRVVIFSR